MAKRSGANAEKSRSKKREKISNAKPGRFVLLVVLIAVAGFYGSKGLKKLDLTSKVLPMIEVRSVEIIGANRLDSLSLVDAVGIDSGTTVLSADRADILSRLEEFPGIKSVKMGSRFSKKMKIKVVEREPVAFAIIDGSLYFMGEDGVIWPFTSGGYWEIPVVTGLNDMITEEGVRRIVDRDSSRFFGIVKSFKNELINRPVSFDLSNQDRITVRFNGLEPLVRFSNNPKNRIQNMRGILKKLRSDDVEVRHYIDLSYKNVAFFR